VSIIRLRSVLVAIIACAIVGVGTVEPAVATTAAEPYELRYINSVSDLTQEYGADSPAELRIEIASTTTTLDLRFYFGLSDLTGCSLRDRSGTALASSQQGPTDEEPTFLLPIPAGVLVAGQGYDVTCRNGYYAERGIVWHVNAVSDGVDTTTVLTPDPACLVRIVRENVFFESDTPPERIVPGDVVRVISAPGTWTPPGSTSGTLTVTLNSAGGTPGEVTLRDAVVADDGSTVTFTMPQSVPFGYSGGVFIIVEVSGTTPADGSDPEIVNIQRLHATTAPYDSPPAPTVTATTTSLSLSRSTVLYSKSNATVTVSTADGRAALGPILLLGDGNPIARATLSAASGGEIVVTIPRLSRGTHSIVAVFEGTQTQLASSTTPSRLRVLLPREVFQRNG
jgi:hypothetical protein